MRRAGIALAAAGVLMLIAAAVLRFAVTPAAEQLPSDLDETVTYTGTVTTVGLSADTGGVGVTNVPVTAKRTVKVLQTDGDRARVSDTTTMTSTAGAVPPSLARSEYFYAVDRTSLKASTSFPGRPVTKAKGLVVSFPFGTEKKSYTGWVPTLGTTGTVAYKGEGTIRGVTVYRFAGTIREQLPAPPSGAPASLPKAQLAALATRLQLPTTVQQQLAQALPSMPDPVPLTYTYQQGDTYAVAPDTGRIVDSTRNVRITGGVGDLSVPVLTVGVKYDAASIKTMADKAADDRSALRLIGVWLPTSLLVGGVVLLALGLGLRRPHQDDATDSERIGTAGQSRRVRH